ncbi:hypothetical protein [Dyadobacter bucti]|uniref:hypothetical protein n=1 Tax=Dyadobacter bucti TaxID=2572203 RepID=UPI003F71CC92
MKNLTAYILFIAMLAASPGVIAQSEEEKLDLPGDNLNLYAVMKLFQESETLEGFEKKLNDEESEINNLDLDGDDNIDYIRVADQVDGNLHTITLKIAVSDNEDQDVAVFFVEKKDDGQVLIQLVGDEDLYGKNYIIEPASLTENGTPGETPNPGYSGNREERQGTYAADNSSRAISSWPVVQFIFVPNYVIWHSPWRWHYYPSYWRPWRPRYWHYYYGYHYHWRNYYNGHFRRWDHYRNPVWYDRYYGGNHRSRSVAVRTRYARGDYRNTYSRPSSARQGSALFVKRNPTASSSRDRLPSFDKTGRPLVVRPSTGRPSTSRPGTSRPVTSPGTSRPSVTRPGTSRPSVTTPETSRPSVTRPETSRPSVTRPETSRPSVTRPETSRPPVTQPGISRPAPSRPATTRPAARPSTSPAARPAATPGSSRERPRGNESPRN